jgi:hypothetical protein
MNPISQKSAGSLLRALLCLACVTALPVHAQVYKSVDANGKVVYSDAPPVQGKKVEVVKGTSAPSNAAGAAPDWQERDREFRGRKMLQDDAARKQEEESKQAAKERNSACLMARDHIEELTRGVPVYRMNEKGERVYLDDAERNATLKRARQSVVDNCPR